MDLTFAQLSLSGPVRPHNEDSVGFFHPDDPEELRNRGSVAILADGVGGQGKGEVASHLAVETALKKFHEARPGTAPNQLLWQLITAANLAVYDAGMADRGEGRMATTLTVALFRNNEVSIGHVGDCRLYHVHLGAVQRVTADHSYAGMQVKMGLISAQDAANSPMRSMLTRSIGKDPTVQIDYHTVTVHRGDVILLCSDGLHAYVSDQDILEAVGRHSPEEACRILTDLAQKRGTDDNLSIQVAHIDRVELLSYYRGVPVYQDAPDETMSNEIQVGQVLDERFHITAVISRSGMGSIFKAVDMQNGQPVAVKAPFMQFESDPGFFQRFEREEAIGKALRHPYVLKIIPVEGKSRPYIVMEFLEGQTLRQLLRSLGRLEIADALKIGSRLCEGLDYMHQNNVVHRDLKPENIMLCHDGTLRIMDFGIAKAAGMRRLTFTGFSPAMGTPDYMAPEQVKGKRGDERTDIYSLGAMLYEMVTGQAPFEGANPYMIMNARLTGDPVAPRKINPQISPQVEEIILHAMARNPWDRYASAAEMKADLDNPDSVQLTGRHERLQAPVLWRTKWRTVRLVVVALLIPVIVFGLMFLLFLHPWRS